MNTLVLTNILLTGILLLQAFAIIFRDKRKKTPLNWRELEKANNPPKFPIT